MLQSAYPCLTGEGRGSRHLLCIYGAIQRICLSRFSSILILTSYIVTQRS
ncbi:hypothetical protein BDA96_05G129300 [Sorghum bicolor]|uniref:Uncharacterized protein n=1 Tax=Sorghum bicolor TaxID=4558 RepID=A0A921UGG1_SORBI|nr:hypothetical protein BDA96_05G129300 [Sorghum bicolor]